MIKQIATFKGKKLIDMSKEELIESVELVCNLRERDRLEHKRQLEFLSGLNAQRNRGFFYNIFRSIFG